MRMSVRLVRYYRELEKIRGSYVIPPPSLSVSTHTHNLALEFMFQFPICAAYNVPGYRRVRRLDGILCRVRAVLRSADSSIYPSLASPESQRLTISLFPHRSRMKGPSYEQGTRLQAAAGLHHLMANHWHVLVSEIDAVVVVKHPLTCLIYDSPRH
jgi:hypothetical protein